MVKKHIRTFLLIVLFLIGAGIFLYPTVSDLWNKRLQAEVMSSYLDEVGQMTDYSLEWEKARDYNNRLHTAADLDELESLKEENGEYAELLNVSGNDVMGIIRIPKINVELPIYHGTSEDVLKIGAGHVIGSSLPTGETGTHAVISGHRGLPSAKLFTDLDQIEEGDTFTLSILDKEFTYTVDSITVVEPHEVDSLQPVEGKDYVTLVTCTPYGINSHRLLIRGERSN